MNTIIKVMNDGLSGNTSCVDKCIVRKASKDITIPENSLFAICLHLNKKKSDVYLYICDNGEWVN